jgi:hypothetical protein
MGTDLCVHARLDFPSWCRSWSLVEAVGLLNRQSQEAA